MPYVTVEEELSAALSAAGLGPGGLEYRVRSGMNPETVAGYDAAVVRAISGGVIAGLIERGELELARRDTAVRRCRDGNARSSVEEFVLRELSPGRATWLRRVVGWVEVALADGSVKYAAAAPRADVVSRLAGVVGRTDGSSRDCLLLAMLHVTKCEVPVLGPQLAGRSDRQIRAASRIAGRSDPLAKAMLTAMGDRALTDWVDGPLDVLMDFLP